MRRVGAVVVLCALAAASLVACAPELRASWTPASWEVEGQVVDLPTVSAPDAEDPASVDTLRMRLRNDDVGIDARWAMLPGAPAVNAVLEQAVRTAVAERAGAANTPYRPQVADVGAGLADRGCTPGAMTVPATEVLGARTGTVVVCEIVVARGSLFAESLRTVTGTGGVIQSDVTTTFYSDLTSGVVGTGADLFADPAALWTMTVDILRRTLGSLSLAPVGPPDEAQLQSFAGALERASLRDGKIVIPVPDDLHAPELDGLVRWQNRGDGDARAVEITSAAASAALTPLGMAVADATGDYAGPVSAGAGFERIPCDLVPCMAMTIDDGPSPLTPTFLDALKAQQSAATFFMLGQNAQRYPDTVARVAGEGNQVGNHTWDHKYLTDLTDAEVRAEIGDARTLLQRLSGQPVATFRPPGGFVDNQVIALAGQPAILWSVDTRDWSGTPDDELRNYAIERPREGTIILMHDIQDNSSRVFSDVIAGLRDRGLYLVTIDALFGGAVPSGEVRYGPVL